MHVGTDGDVIRLLSDQKWNSGLYADGTALYYKSAEAECLELKFPDWPGKVSYFAARASRLGLPDADNFSGALLWITYSEPGSLSPIGWKLVEKMRQGYGENRSINAARAHFFRTDELVDLQAFLLPCFIFGWDAYLIPFGHNDFFVHISHDEYWGVVTKTRKAYDRVGEELKDLNPMESPGMRSRFCCPDVG